MKSIGWISLIVIIVLVGVSGWVYVIFEKDRLEDQLLLQTVQCENDKQQGDALINNCETEATTLINEINISSNVIEDLEEQISAIEEENSNFSEKLNTANDNIQALTVTIQEKDLKLGELTNQLETAEKVADGFMCSNKPEGLIFNYSSNGEISRTLKNYLQDAYEPINSAKWEILFDDSDISIHQLEGEYLYVYVVFFADPDRDKISAVYDVWRQCYLDINN